MNIVQVKNICFGEGIPKICVSIIGTTKDEIIEQAKNLKEDSVDVIEWRADWFHGVFRWNEVQEILEELHDILEEIPLIFTFRTKEEGGEKSIAAKDYKTLLEQVAESQLVDLIDVELFQGKELVCKVIEYAHRYNVKVIVSNHDFAKTPSKEEMLNRLCQMQEYGGDLLKIAVMPQSKKDVLTLLETTVEMQETKATQPLITMSMAKQGVISRLCGEMFGSVMTFGAGENVSAVGQVKIQKLRTILNELHTLD